MRPAIEIAKAVYSARFWSDKDAAAVIEADRLAVRADERAKVVAEIVEAFKQQRAGGGRTIPAALWAIQFIEAKFATPVMENPYNRSAGDE